MARRSGIPEERLRRLGEELERAKRGDFGGYGERYREALFPPQDEGTGYEGPKAARSTSELLMELGLDETSLDDISVSTSSRVRFIAFTPNVDIRSVLETAVDQGSASIALGGITGSIEVKWVNGKRDWEYRGATLRDFINFKNAGDGGGSFGKYVNEVMNNFTERGPL